ncbi:MAG: replication initiator protein [Microviridae sp.]|nr:MAG: replication initiator protein [Microviridae sp.]
MCGEYGGLVGRPHYHACLFGVDFDDKVHFSRSADGSAIYTSKTLDGIWKKGFCTVGQLNFLTAAYVARYVMKKVTGDLALAHYVDPLTGVIRSSEFNHMSLKPGIGAMWFSKFKSDVFPHDRVVVNGQVMKPPKYYDRLLSKLDGLSFEEIQFLRYEKFSTLESRADSTPERLKVREVVTKARLAFKKRSL